MGAPIEIGATDPDANTLTDAAPVGEPSAIPAMLPVALADAPAEAVPLGAVSAME